MINQFDVSTRLSADLRGLDKLRAGARANDPEATKEAARQFEALFLGMMLKSMREGAGEGGMLDNPQSKMFTGMMDQQVAQKLASGRGVGLADFMVRQLTRAQADGVTKAAQSGGAAAAPISGKAAQAADPAPIPAPRAASTVAGSAVRADPGPAPKALEARPGAAQTPAASAEPAPAAGRHPVRDFLSKVVEHAKEAAQHTGIPAHFMLGHAALESGWGRREVRGVDGARSHNLFGIKAGAGWTGRTVDAVTTEFVNGKAVKTVQKFRAYDSYGESFRDYARTLRDNPRYAAAVAGRDAHGFASGLQKGGYATDPRYADKLARVINGAALKQTLEG